MNQLLKSLIILVFLTGNLLITLADRGIGKKSRNKITLNVPISNSFKNSLSFNLKTGLKYKGSILKEVKNDMHSYSSTNLITYQKGNTVYIVPSKQKIIIPEIKQGYTGMKLIISPN